MNFNDIFKRAFIEGFSGQVNSAHITISLLITSILAIYIFFVYRLMTRKTFYSKNMNITLAAISVITAAIILAVQSNIVLSLGMVGALSIVRFRTAIKDPIDLTFLFWSISIGIICGAGLAEIAVMLSLILTVGIFVLDRIPIGKAPMMLVINSSSLDVENDMTPIINKYCSTYKIKSRNHTSQRFDMIAEVRLKDEHLFIRDISSIPGIGSVNLLSHDGEVTF